MQKSSFRSWLSNLVGESETKPDTRARLGVQSLDVRTLPTVASGMSAVCGAVYVDANGNGMRDCGEAGIAGVKVTLTGTSAAGQAVCRTVTTDCDGNFAITNLAKGCYTLTETQPAGYRDGAERGPTSATGNDTFGSIRLDGSNKLSGYTFGELKQTPSCDDGKGSKGKGSKGKGSKGKGSQCKGTSGKGSRGKGSKGKGSSGKCDLWSGYHPKLEPGCAGYQPCGYGYQPCDDDKGSHGKGSKGKGTSGKGSSDKGSHGKGSDGKGSKGKGSQCKGTSGKGSHGKGSGGKGSSGKGSKGKGSKGKGNDCGIYASHPKAFAASVLSNLYGIASKRK